MKGNLLLPVLLIAISGSAFAARNSKVQLDNTGVDWQDKIIGAFQSLINMVGGPGVLLIAFTCIIAVICIYLFMPRNPIFPWVLRGAIGLVLIFNVPLIITWLSSF